MLDHCQTSEGGGCSDRFAVQHVLTLPLKTEVPVRPLVNVSFNHEPLPSVFSCSQSTETKLQRDGRSENKTVLPNYLVCFLDFFKCIICI